MTVNRMCEMSHCRERVSIVFLIDVREREREGEMLPVREKEKKCLSVHCERERKDDNLTVNTYSSGHVLRVCVGVFEVVR